MILPLILICLVLSGIILYRIDRKQKDKKYDQSIRNFLSGKDKWVIIFFIFATVTINAQTFELITKTGSGFDVESGTITTETFECEGKIFDVFETKTGSKYIKAISVTNKMYPVWIGTKSEYKHERKSVYKFKSGKYATFKLNKNSYPVAEYLTLKAE